MKRRMMWILGIPLLLVANAFAAQVRGEVQEGGEGWTERVEKRVEAGKGGTLMLVADIGGIEVDTWSEKGVRVVVEKEADVFTRGEAEKVLENCAVYVEQKGKDVGVRIESKSGRRLRRLDVRIEVTVPEQYSVDLETEAGGIEVGDLEGEVKAETSGGGIEVGKIRNGSVDIRTSGGGLSIEGVENGNAYAKTSGGGIEVGDVSGDLVAETSGGGIHVGRVGGQMRVHTSGGGIEIEEGGKTVSAKTAGGGIQVGKAGGDVEVKTAGGGIEVGPVKGRIEAHTAGGGIDIGKTEGAVMAETAGGGISVDGSGGPVEVHTSGGGIRIEGARGYIEARTSGGGITAELAIADREADTHCTLESSGGDITIYLPADLAATIDADLRIERRSRENYRIVSDFPLEIQGAEEESRRITGEGTINGGGDLIKLQTTNGDIEIRKR